MPPAPHALPGDRGLVARLVRRLATSLVAPLAGVLVATLVAVTVLAASARIETPRCDGVHLRVGPGTGYASVTAVDRGARLTVVDEVHGGAWSSLCAGSTTSSSRWAVISEINGRSVRARFGVGRLYAGADLLRVLGPAPTPRPTAPPSTTPQATVMPSAETPSPTPVPTAKRHRKATAAPTASAPPTQTDAASTPSIAAPSTAAEGIEGGALVAIVLVLALLMPVLATVVLRDRRRRRAMFDIPPSRIDDVRS